MHAWCMHSARTNFYEGEARLKIYLFLLISFRYCLKFPLVCSELAPPPHAKISIDSPVLHSLGCIHLVALTWLHSLDSIHLIAFTWLDAVANAMARKSVTRGVGETVICISQFAKRPKGCVYSSPPFSYLATQ